MRLAYQILLKSLP